MKLALISDIHGNLEALVSVLSHIEEQKADKIHCLGDVIGYGSDPVSCLELVAKNCDIKLLGNHEHAAMGIDDTSDYNPAAQKSTEWTKHQLSDREKSMLAEFEMSRVLDNTLLVHASPCDPEQWPYILTPEAALDAFVELKQTICFFGHSHVPQIYCERDEDLPRMQVGHDFAPDPENRYLVNVGSVGQPRDNDPRACYVTFDTEEFEIFFHRVDYDIETAQDKMAQANLPQMLIARLSLGR
ncbi:MAG: metallophosphoesterase family protein [Candidatus Zixiibacteriota bacterium]|nr:MAG: metallophosphoesterase family protein [candidate division Zixibacteria bacterium]